MSEAVNRGLDATHGRSQSRASRSAVEHAGWRPVSDEHICILRNEIPLLLQFIFRKIETSRVGRNPRRTPEFHTVDDEAGIAQVVDAAEQELSGLRL